MRWDNSVILQFIKVVDGARSPERITETAGKFKQKKAHKNNNNSSYIKQMNEKKITSNVLSLWLHSIREYEFEID